MTTSPSNLPVKNTTSHLLALWRNASSVAENVVDWHLEPPRPANFAPFPADLHPDLCDYLRGQGIFQLYAHQLESWQAAREGRNVVVVTGTASGKTLCYNLPILDRALTDPKARALYLFPTKALTQDQFNNLRAASAALDGQIKAAVYDGDTPQDDRPAIRRDARLVLTNPDMLHTGVLPHHTRWAEFFRNLRCVIIDEIHVYRGVFGSHVANLIRRLKRVAAFYGAYPQFFLTSATIANPGQLAERLIELPVTVVDQDGSPRGRRHFLLYNPPIVNAELGLRASAASEAIRLTGDLLDLDVQTLLFCRTRRSVEILFTYLQQSRLQSGESLHAYRSGYLPTQRRKIERSLREGEARAVVATNALELGIDIGGMDAVVLVGYPGTIASTRQQSGRAGRKQGDSLAILVASMLPIDQFLMQHPDFIFDRSPEQAYINPDNLLILLQHLRCAAFELPFRRGDTFGRVPAALLSSFLDLLNQAGEMHESGDRYFWMADKYPSEAVSLRSSSPDVVVLQVPTETGGARTIGEVDRESALWMVHPDAVYLHSGESYEVESLDLENKVAHLKPATGDYYTEPKIGETIEKLSLIKQDAVPGGTRNFGEVMVTTQVTGYRRVRWYTNENLGEGTLDLPITQLRTVGYWITIDPNTVDHLRDSGLWNSDHNDYGPDWQRIRKLVLQRDNYTCQSCNAVQNDRPFHVHHKVPLRSFTSLEMAHRLDNLVTLCPNCHHRAELSVLVRSGLSGLRYVLQNLAPLFVMCDVNDLGAQSDPLSPVGDKQPTVVIWDHVPAGIGLSQALYDLHSTLVARAYELVSRCGCKDGCPSCVGPAGENGVGGKEGALTLLKALVDQSINQIEMSSSIDQ